MARHALTRPDLPITWAGISGAPAMWTRFPIIGLESASVTALAALSVEPSSAPLVYERGVVDSRIAIRTNGDGERLPVLFHSIISLPEPPETNGPFLPLPCPATLPLSLAHRLIKRRT